jgi:hypothetical protein
MHNITHNWQRLCPLHTTSKSCLDSKATNASFKLESIMDVKSIILESNQTNMSKSILEAPNVEPNME